MERLRTYIDSFRGFEPDARRFLLVTLVMGAAGSLWWIDFNLYLAALGLSRSTIGIISTVGAAASAAAALPASAISDRVGRRLVMAGGAGLATLALVLLDLTAAVPAIFLAAAAYSAGWSALNVAQGPFLTEHSKPEHRSELFALQFAIGTGTNIGAAVIGGVVAGAVADAIGLDPGGVGPYRVILLLMTAALAGGLLILLTITRDRPPGGARDAEGRPASGSRFGITITNRGRFARLVLPGFLISIGAGQVLPFMNLFIQGKFGLDLASLNVLFALTSLGTMLAVLFQPVIAKRLGRLPSVVIVQGISIPFLVVLGFSPLLWTVIAAMTVRNSLMNAGNPIFFAFALDQVAPAERATFSAVSALLWSAGWALAGPWYSILQANLGFDAGYAVNFATIIVLYTVATVLLWLWFRDAEPRPDRSLPAAALPGASA